MQTRVERKRVCNAQKKTTRAKRYALTVSVYNKIMPLKMPILFTAAISRGVRKNTLRYNSPANVAKHMLGLCLFATCEMHSSMLDLM